MHFWFLIVTKSKSEYVSKIKISSEVSFSQVAQKSINRILKLFVILLFSTKKLCEKTFLLHLNFFIIILLFENVLRSDFDGLGFSILFVLSD